MISQWDHWYHDMLAKLIGRNRSMNERTGEEVYALPCLGFTLEPSNLIPVLSTRRMYPKSAAAEVAWQLMGTQSVEWINKHCPLWKDFADERGVVESAYGWRWKREWGFDQLNEVMVKLMNDPSSRQCHITTFSPHDLVEPKPNIPCPTAFTVNIINNQLHMSVHMRSSDVLVGLPYDVMAYAYLQSAMAATLHVSTGCLQFTLAHAHLYQKHEEIALTMIGKYNDGHAKGEPYSPYRKSWSMKEILDAPDDYVEQVQITTPNGHPYRPKPEIFQ